MIFWVLVALTVLITAFVFAANVYYYDFGLGFGMAVISLIVCGGISALIFVACGSWIPSGYELVKDDTSHLKALGNNSSIEGRSYFLGGGYVKDKRVLNFITQGSDGAIRVQQTQAGTATIFEGNRDATVEVKRFDRVNGWISPWPIGTHDDYIFRIPTGSVVESYTLDNSK